MNILVVSPYIMPEGGGQGKLVSKITQKLADRSHEVTVVAATREAEEKSIENRVHIIKIKPDFILSNTPVKLDLLRRLNSIVNENKPDAIYAHTPVPYFADVANIVAKKHGIPLILHYHTGSLIKERPILDALAFAYMKTAERILLSSAKKIIVHNPYIKEVTLKGYEEKTVVIPPGVNTRRFKPPAEYAKKKLLFVGQLISAHQMKGLVYLIEAMKHVRKVDDRVTLDVVGGGDMLNFYTSLAKGYGVSDKITFHGQVPNNLIHEYYQKSSVLVLPSYSNAEGFGLVVLEANACGVPAVVSSVGGLTRTVSEGVNGFFVPPKDSMKLAEKILEVFSDEGRLARMRKSSREFALKHDWDKVVEGVERCIYSALEK